MKKLMMAAAGVLLAGSSFAYSYKWYVGSDAVTFDGAAVQNATVYLFNAKDYTQAALVTALSGSSLSSIAAANGLATSVKTGSDGVASTYSADFSNIGTVYDSSGLNKFQTYFALVNADSDHVFISTTLTSTRDESTASAVTEFVFDGKYSDYLSEKYAAGSSWSDSGWYGVESVPEPFSGSLALLGVGLVALRRKMKKQKKA